MLTVAAYLCSFICACGALWLFANAAASLTRSGATPVGLLGLATGLALMACSASGALSPAVQTTTAFMLRMIPCALGCLFSLICALLELATCRVRKDPGASADFIIVHGAALKGERPSPFLAERLDCAIIAWQRRKGAPTIIVSGGQGSDEIASEASVMCDYLVAHGISRTSIVLENRSTTTEENLLMSRELIRSISHGAAPTIALVSTDFHIPRCLLLARRLGLSPIGIGASAAPLRYPRARIREIYAFAATLLHIK